MDCYVLRRGENDDVTALGCWFAEPSVNILFPEHISESTCPTVIKLYTQHLEGLGVPFAVYEL